MTAARPRAAVAPARGAQGELRSPGDRRRLAGEVGRGRAGGARRDAHRAPGLVTVAAPEEIRAEVDAGCVEAMTLPLPADARGAPRERGRRRRSRRSGPGSARRRSDPGSATSRRSRPGSAISCWASIFRWCSTPTASTRSRGARESCAARRAARCSRRIPARSADCSDARHRTAARSASPRCVTPPRPPVAWSCSRATRL